LQGPELLPAPHLCHCLSELINTEYYNHIIIHNLRKKTKTINKMIKTRYDNKRNNRNEKYAKNI